MTDINEIKIYLENQGWSEFYHPDYWIKNGNEYKGMKLSEAYCLEKYSKIDMGLYFEKVTELERQLHINKCLYIEGSTYKLKEDLKNNFNAKWDHDKRKWYVNNYYINSLVFHEWCYIHKLRFKWE